MESNLSNWQEEYNQPRPEGEKERLPKFGITLAKGEIARSEEITFVTSGAKIENQYGKSIVFTVNHKGVDMVWFVKAKSYSILNQIAKQKDLVGKVAVVTRAGTTQSDTRWAIHFKQN